MAAFIDWPDRAGRVYRYFFLIDPSIAPINPVPGGYMFVRQTQPGFWYPVYIGIADNLAERLRNHERWRDAVACGASHVMLASNPVESMRRAEERDLISWYNPTCNIQHRTPLGLGLFGSLNPLRS
jgi:hypothetical protein